MHRPHHISDRNILSIPDNIANHQKENTAACWYSESNMVTAPWGWRAVTTVLKQGSKSNAVKTSCFRHFSLGMYWLKRLKVMEGLPRKLISGNPRSTLWLFFGQGCMWVTFQRLKLEQSAPRLFHKNPLADLRLQSQASFYICIYPGSPRPFKQRSLGFDLCL